jgi:hypothetical protein
VSRLEDRSSRRQRSHAIGVGGRIDARPSRIAAVRDIARTLLVLTGAGVGIVMLRFLLVLARGAIGQ